MQCATIYMWSQRGVRADQMLRLWRGTLRSGLRLLLPRPVLYGGAHGRHVLLRRRVGCRETWRAMNSRTSGIVRTALLLVGLSPCAVMLASPTSVAVALDR